MTTLRTSSILLALVLVPAVAAAAPPDKTDRKAERGDRTVDRGDRKAGPGDRKAGPGDRKAGPGGERGPRGPRGDHAALTPGQRAQHGLERGDRMFDRFDANRDGVLTLRELPADKSTRFARLDVDRDGRITKAEIAARMSAKMRTGEGGFRGWKNKIVDGKPGPDGKAGPGSKPGKRGGHRGGHGPGAKPGR